MGKREIVCRTEKRF